MRIALITFFSFFILNAISPLLENNGVVDIGRSNTTNKIEVPKEYIYTEPNTTKVPNRIIYNDRIQSELFQCEIDFLGTETCPNGQEECPVVEELSNGFSTAHAVTKTFIRICPNNTVLIDTRCYLDENGDSQKDNKHTVDYKYALSKKGSSWPAGWGGILSSYHTNIGNYSYKFYADRNGTYRIQHQVDNYASIYIDGALVDSSSRWQTIKNKYLYLSKGEHQIRIKAGNWSGPYGMAVLIYNPSGSLFWNNRKGQAIKSTACPSGFNVDGYYCYNDSVCPSNTVAQSNGSCKMDYTWYSYHCDANTNYYENKWKVVNAGGDCGDITCINPSSPPLNNCVRVDYLCPLDPNKKCGKTVVDTIDCGTGYVWNSNRCERIESYCGNSTYNANKDICENITLSIKLCKNSSDVYDISSNNCVSNTEICKDGTYDEVTKFCKINFTGTCDIQGYVYNVVTEKCENPSRVICPSSEYNYDPVLKKCKGNMNVCASDETYNDTLNLCEKNTCGILGLSDSGSRCETISQCNGIITSSGSCIPNTIQ